MLENIRELHIKLWNNFQITSGKFPLAEIKILSVGRYWDNFEVIFVSDVTTVLSTSLC